MHALPLFDNFGSRREGENENIDIKNDELAVKLRGEINIGDMDKVYFNPFPMPKRTKAIQSRGRFVDPF